MQAILINIQFYTVMENHLIMLIAHTSSFPDLLDFMLIISMVWIPRVEEIELRISKFILTNPSLKLWPITSYEACGLVNNV